MSAFAALPPCRCRPCGPGSLADQVRTIAKERLRQRMGAVVAAEMSAIDRAIRVQLGLQ